MVQDYKSQCYETFLLVMSFFFFKHSFPEVPSSNGVPEVVYSFFLSNLKIPIIFSRFEVNLQNAPKINPKGHHERLHTLTRVSTHHIHIPPHTLTCLHVLHGRE